jgi:pyocin large subunit-like protein
VVGFGPCSSTTVIVLAIPEGDGSAIIAVVLTMSIVVDEFDRAFNGLFDWWRMVFCLEQMAGSSKPFE